MATSTAQTDEHVSLKLVLNEKGNKVLFAEAGKDFVDILCSFLTMPLGTIARLVEKKSSIGPVTVGCLNSLYQSVADLDESCFCNDTVKQMLLQPSNSAEDYCKTLKLNIDDTQPTKYFACNNDCCSYNDLTTSPYKDKHKCRCGCEFASLVFVNHSRQGFVNGGVTFVITDDLKVIPNGIDYTSLSMLQEKGIQNPSLVKEVVLNVTKEKVLDLLKHSLLSTSTLTNLFFGKKPSVENSMFFWPDCKSSGEIGITMKLVIRKSDGKLLYAQVEQDFADKLLSFLTIPLGVVAQIFGVNGSVADINRLYKSISDLNKNKYFISKEAKKILVDVFYHDDNPIQFFKHHDKHKTYTGKRMTSILGNDIVKSPGMYAVTDDLAIAPLTPVLALGLLNRLETPLTDLKEKVVIVRDEEFPRIFMACLSTTSALTNGLAHLLTEVKDEK